MVSSLLVPALLVSFVSLIRYHLRNYPSAPFSLILSCRKTNVALRRRLCTAPCPFLKCWPAYPGQGTAPGRGWWCPQRGRRWGSPGHWWLGPRAGQAGCGRQLPRPSFKAARAATEWWVFLTHTPLMPFRRWGSCCLAPRQLAMTRPVSRGGGGMSVWHSGKATSRYSGIQCWSSLGLSPSSSPNSCFLLMHALGNSGRWLKSLCPYCRHQYLD